MVPSLPFSVSQHACVKWARLSDWPPGIPNLERFRSETLWCTLGSCEFFLIFAFPMRKATKYKQSQVSLTVRKATKKHFHHFSKGFVAVFDQIPAFCGASSSKCRTHQPESHSVEASGNCVLPF